MELRASRPWSLWIYGGPVLQPLQAPTHPPSWGGGARVPAAAGQASACLPAGPRLKYDRIRVEGCTGRTSAGGGQNRRPRDANMVPLRLLAFSLLAAACYFTPGAEAEVVYACHNDTVHMGCDVDQKLTLTHILYKVGVGTRCGEGKAHPDDGPDSYCSFPWAEMVVEDLCENKRSCKVPVTERVFGEYPCLEPTRYLEVSYSCVRPTPPPPPPAPLKPECEEKEANKA